MRQSKPKKENISKKTNKAKGYFVLFVGDEGAVMIYYQNKQVVRRLFATSHDDKTATALVDLLEEFPQSPVYVLVDLLDQAYVRHTLPPVTSLGVNKIIQRRLSRDFAATDLKGAIPLGREKNGRKDWNFLLISLSYNAKLKGWLELIYDLPNRLMGIYLVPVESEAIIKSLKAATGQKANLKKANIGLKKAKTAENAPPKWDILVLHNKTGGFRQVVLKDNKIIFTRMAQADPNEKPSVMAGNVEQEVKNTIEYLKRLAFSQGAELNIIVIIAEEIKVNINPEAFNAKSCIIYTPHEAGELLNIGEAVLSGDKFTDIFLSCAFLQHKKHRLKLMSPSIKKTEQLYKTIHLSKIAAKIAVLGLVGFSAYNGYMGYNLAIELHRKQQEIKSITNRAEDFAEKTGKFAVDPQKIDALVKIDDLISVKTEDYNPFIMGIAENVNENAYVKNFEWINNNTSKPILVPATPPTDMLPKIEAKIDWELIVVEGEEKQAKIMWEELQQDLQKSLKSYQINDEGIEGMRESEDKLTVNFSNKTGINPNNDEKIQQKLIAKMKITPATTPTQNP